MIDFKETLNITPESDVKRLKKRGYITWQSTDNQFKTMIKVLTEFMSIRDSWYNLPPFMMTVILTGESGQGQI